MSQSPERFGAYYIERIAQYHNRKSFNCNKSSMNDFLVNHGLSQAHGETWVVVPRPQSAEIIAYYTIIPDPVELGGEDLDDIEAEIIQLERLAVDLRYQKQGLGRNLLLRLIIQTFELSRTLNVEALNLFALDADAKNWYLKLDLGFEELAPGSKNLTLPLSTIRLLFDNANAPSQPE